MSLFRCSQCDTVDNTAVSDYYQSKRDRTPAICTFCSRGVWHGHFARMTFKEYCEVNRGSYITEGGFILTDKPAPNREKRKELRRTGGWE